MATKLQSDGMRARRFKTSRTIVALILREMSTTYGRSPGGYVWAILEPVAGIVVMSFGFSLLMRAPALGTSFALFFATGFLPFTMYQQLSQKVTAALNFSKALLSYPGVTVMDSLLARSILAVLTQLMVFYIVITGILIFQTTGAIINFPQILMGLSMAALLGIGVGALNSVISGFWPVWNQIWGILMRPMFFISGVIFLYEDMPASLQAILWYNPLIHVTGLLRRGFYVTYGGEYISPLFGYGCGAVLLAFGLAFLLRYHKDILIK